VKRCMLSYKCRTMHRFLFIYFLFIYVLFTIYLFIDTFINLSMYQACKFNIAARTLQVFSVSMFFFFYFGC
jgi:hypothetical protein